MRSLQLRFFIEESHSRNPHAKADRTESFGLQNSLGVQLRDGTHRSHNDLVMSDLLLCKHTSLHFLNTITQFGLHISLSVVSDALMLILILSKKIKISMLDPEGIKLRCSIFRLKLT